LDIPGDISQASLAAMMIVLGRPLRENEYPDALSTLVSEVIEIAQIRGSSHFGSGLQAYLERTLPLPSRTPHANAAEAAAEVRHIAREIGVSRCRTALTAFVDDMNRVLAEERAQAERAAHDSELVGIDAAVDELAAAMIPDLSSGSEDLGLADPPITIDPLLEPSTPAFDEFDASVGTDVFEDPPTAIAESALPERANFDIAPLVESDAPVEVEHAHVTSEPVAFETRIAPEPPRPEPVAVPEPIVEAHAIASTAPVAEPSRLPTPPPVPEPVKPEAPTAVVTPRVEAAPSVPQDTVTPAAAAAATTATTPVPVPTPPTPPAPAPTLPPPAPAPQQETKAQSKRNKRGSKRRRDKLRSNAAPPPAKPAPAPPPPPVAIPMPTYNSPPPAVAIPMPTYNPPPDPFRQNPPPPLPAPIAVQPPAPPAPAAPLRLKSEAPADAPLRLKTDSSTTFNRPPARIDRRDAPHIGVPSFEREQPDGSSEFPWRLAAAAVVGIIALIGVGRYYLASHNAPTETVEPAPVKEAAAPEKVEAGKPGSVAITTQPAGAHVFLDGKPVGDSPVTLQGVATGKHTLTFVTSSGTVKKPIRVEPGKPLSVDVPIYSGWIAVFSPVTLDIAENGKSIGTTEQGRLMLSPGRHTLTFSSQDMGYKTTQAVDIEPGEERSVSLVPTGELNANATPWAEVWMNGNKVGETPIAALRVPLGTHEVVFKNPKFPDRQVTVTVRATAPAIAFVDFTK
jgi:hypothetical protein